MILTQNRIYAFYLGMITTVLGWYSLLLMTQKKIKIKRRHYIGLGIAFLSYTLWWFKYCYIIESN